MNRPIEVKEFESIICNKDYEGDENYTYISKKDFENLKSFISDTSGNEENSDALDFMKIGYKRNVGDTVIFKNYVGLIQVKNGFQIQVLPKIDCISEQKGSNAATKKLFLKMLRSMRDFPSKVFNDATLRIDQMNLYEIFINMYIQEARLLVKRGIKSDYLNVEDNMKYYKGKLLVGEHIRANIAHKERFYVSFEEYNQNRVENRLVKATLEKLQSLTNSAENSKELRKLLISFEMIDASTDYQKDFAKVIINRSTKDYENLMKWSRVFLMNESFSTFSGTTTSRALLFPMESVYESYVAREMRKALTPEDWSVSTQERGKYLFEKPKEKFSLRPDIVLRRGEHTVIMDTKWKKLSPGENNYGISSGDMYQMYAYSKKFGTSDIWLLYPDNNEMHGRTDIIFESGDGTRVRVWFVELNEIETNMLKIKDILDK